jgi:hypothetical protein
MNQHRCFVKQSVRRKADAQYFNLSVNGIYRLGLSMANSQSGAACTAELLEAPVGRMTVVKSETLLAANYELQKRAFYKVAQEYLNEFRRSIAKDAGP